MYKAPNLSDVTAQTVTTNDVLLTEILNLYGELANFEHYRYEPMESNNRLQNLG